MRNPHRFVWLACLLVLASGPTVLAQQQQQGNGQQNGKPIMVGRLSLTEGQVLRYVYDDKDWVATIKDTPFGAEDSLYSDQDGKAEILIPNNTWIRIGGDTQIQGIALEDDLTEVDVASGMTRFYSRGGKTVVKATTPFGYVVAPADSRFDLYVGDESVEVIALKGTVDFIHAKNEARHEVASGAPSLIADAREVTSGDGNVDASWDDWNISRDNLWTKRVEVKGDSHEYLPPQLQDEAYELEENGRWERVQYEGQYRNLWRPANVAPGWSPYSYGRWFDYYGDQCWIPYEPFGYVTHHYGNWIYASNYWYWAPPVVSVGVSVGPAWGLGFGWYPGRVSWLHSDAYVGWVPLAPFEPYYSRRYWGPASFAVASVGLPGISINIGGLHWLNHGVFINHHDFYRGHGHHGYHGVRITNINRTTIINNYHGSPVVNNRVIRNFDTMRERFNVTDARVINKPHRSVVERIDRNQRLAERFRGERVQGDRVLRDAQGVRQGQLATNARVERPRVSNKLVPSDQVDRPKSELRLQQRELVRQERSQSTSEQRLQRQDEKQQRLQDRQNLRDQRELRQGGSTGQTERQIRPERPQRERLDQLRQQRDELRQQRQDSGAQGQQQRLGPQERRQQQLDERRQQLDQRRQREDAGSQTQQQRVNPQERRQQLMDQRQQQPDLRQQGSGSQLDRRQQLEERRQQQMMERQQMRDQQGGRQMLDRRQDTQDLRQQQRENRRLQTEQNRVQQQQDRRQQMQEQRQQQMQDRRQQLQEQKQGQQQQRQQQQRRNRPEEQNPHGVPQ
ncbi:MAG: DUF6600 domain-containing protein [Syntrophobacteraceae bacterium]